MPLPTRRTTQTQNKRTRTRTHDPSVRAGEDNSCFGPRDHCDRPYSIYRPKRPGSNGRGGTLPNYICSLQRTSLMCYGKACKFTVLPTACLMQRYCTLCHSCTRHCVYCIRAVLDSRVWRGWYITQANIIMAICMEVPWKVI
jgi:hypothetical protein